MEKYFFNKKLLTLVSLFFFLFFVFGQTRTIDSLKKQIGSLKDDHKKAETVFLLCDQYRSLHPDTLYELI